MIFLLIAVSIFGLDYYVKKQVEQKKKPGEEEPLLGKRIMLRRTANYGTAGGFLKNHARMIGFIQGFSMLFIAAAYIKLFMVKGMAGLKLAGAWILGGGASNLYDRLKKGYVTDYIRFDVPVKFIKRLVFNISDFFIIAGALLAVIFNIVVEMKK